MSFVCIFLLMLLLQLKNSTRSDYEKHSFREGDNPNSMDRVHDLRERRDSFLEKPSPTPFISSKISVKDKFHQVKTLTELEIEFTNISVLKEVMIKG